MSVAVMGGGSYVKRPWDDGEHHNAESHHVLQPTTIAGIGRHFSAASSPSPQHLPPIATALERPSRLQHEPPQSDSMFDAMPYSPPSPPPLVLSAKRPRLNYDHVHSSAWDKTVPRASTMDTIRDQAFESSSDKGILQAPTARRFVSTSSSRVNHAFAGSTLLYQFTGLD